MKVNRRRTLFYQRRTSNLYRLFILVMLIVAGIWITTRLSTGMVRNPFDPTPTSTRTINSLVLEGETQFKAGALDQAIAAYQQAAAQESAGDPHVWTELARIQAYSSRLLSNDADRLKRLTEALQSANQAVAIAPDDSNAFAIRAFVLDWNADPALDPLRPDDKKASDFIFDADQDAVRALSLDNQNPLALAYYAEILVDEQKWEQAVLYIKPALELGPQVMDVHRVHGYYLESTANYRQAIEEYQKALEIYPNLTFLYITIGHNYRTLAFLSTLPSQQSDLYNSARASYAKAITINDQLKISDPSPYLAIAKTYAQQGQFFAAALNAQKAVELDPTNADLYGQLGNIYKRGRNYETSIIALRCAVEGCDPAASCQAVLAGSDCVGVEVKPLVLNPNSATYYLDLGSVLSAFAPNKPEYCPEVVSLLSQIKNAYPDNNIIVRNADVGLAICAEVTAALTPTPATTPGAAANAATATLQPQPSAPVEYVVIAERINVRVEPSGNAGWVRYALKDEVLQVVNITNGWARLLDGTYVLADYIVPRPVSTPTSPAPVATLTPTATPGRTPLP
jgi:tetratricopeptide (TPR) repeat protein